MSTTPRRGRSPAGSYQRGGRAHRKIPATDDGVFCLACWTRTIRDHRHLTRREAAVHTKVSEDWIKEIEYGKIPRREILANLITGYGLDDAQARLTWELWSPPRTLPPIEELRTRIDTPDRRELLALLDRIGIAGTYLSPLWDILAANDTFYRALPGIATHTQANLALWAMPPAPARSPIARLLVDRDRETQFLVGTLRPAFARYRTSPHTATVFDQLYRNPDFHHHWHHRLHVTHGRPLDDPLHLRNPTTHLPYALDLQITEHIALPEIRFLSAWPPPHPGPP